MHTCDSKMYSPILTLENAFIFILFTLLIPLQNKNFLQSTFILYYRISLSYHWTPFSWSHSGPRVLAVDRASSAPWTLPGWFRDWERESTSLNCCVKESQSTSFLLRPLPRNFTNPLINTPSIPRRDTLIWTCSKWNLMTSLCCTTQEMNQCQYLNHAPTKL